jgi:peptidyl-prolyl cis-trans isomerase SurA
MGYENENAFQNYLNNYDLKTKEIKEKIKIETLWNELIYTKYASKINIDKEEIKAKIKKNSYNKKSNEYSLSEIVFNIDLANELNERYEVINKSIKNIGFKNTANIHSLSDTAKLGGQIGWINENQLSKKIIDKIKSLKIGQWSTPLKISNGFLILKVNDKKISNVNIDMGEELKKAANYETNKQLTQYSLIYYNKIKYNQTGNEF